MLSRFSNQAMIAKAHAMYGRRLKTENYNELIRLKSVGELAAYLKKTPGYADVLANIYPESIHRGQLELLLRKAVFTKYSKLVRYDTSGKHSFLSFVVSRLEIEQIMSSIMYLNAGEQEGFITDLPGFLISHASFSLLELAKVRSFRELLTVLQHTPYAAVLRPFVPAEGEKIDYTGCETALNTLYYEQLFKRIDQTAKGKNKEELKNMIRTQVDLLNLSVLFRMKSFFQADADEIRRHLLPFHHHLRKERLDALLNADSGEDVMKFIRSSAYRKMPDSDRYVYIEDYVKQINAYYSKQLMRFSVNAPAVVYGYMELLQLELSNITNIIEGVRYGMTPDNIKKLLILI